MTNRSGLAVNDDGTAERIPNPPRCMMPECDGGDDLKLVRDPSDNQLWMCKSCREEGWPVQIVGETDD